MPPSYSPDPPVKRIIPLVPYDVSPKRDIDEATQKKDVKEHGSPSRRECYFNKIVYSCRHQASHPTLPRIHHASPCTCLSIRQRLRPSRASTSQLFYTDHPCSDCIVLSENSNATPTNTNSEMTTTSTSADDLTKGAARQVSTVSTFEEHVAYFRSEKAKKDEAAPVAAEIAKTELKTQVEREERRKVVKGMLEEDMRTQDRKTERLKELAALATKKPAEESKSDRIKLSFEKLPDSTDGPQNVAAKAKVDNALKDCQRVLHEHDATMKQVNAKNDPVRAASSCGQATKETAAVLDKSNTKPTTKTSNASLASDFIPSSFWYHSLSKTQIPKASTDLQEWKNIKSRASLAANTHSDPPGMIDYYIDKLLQHSIALRAAKCNGAKVADGNAKPHAFAWPPPTKDVTSTDNGGPVKDAVDSSSYSMEQSTILPRGNALGADAKTMYSTTPFLTHDGHTKPLLATNSTSLVMPKSAADTSDPKNSSVALSHGGLKVVAPQVAGRILTSCGWPPKLHYRGQSPPVVGEHAHKSQQVNQVSHYLKAFNESEAKKKSAVAESTKTGHVPAASGKSIPGSKPSALISGNVSHETKSNTHVPGQAFHVGRAKEDIEAKKKFELEKTGAQMQELVRKGDEKGLPLGSTQDTMSATTSTSSDKLSSPLTDEENYISPNYHGHMARDLSTPLMTNAIKEHESLAASVRRPFQPSVYREAKITEKDLNFDRRGERTHGFAPNTRGDADAAAPKPDTAATTAQKIPKTEWPASLRAYVNKSFQKENLVADVSWSEIEMYLKNTIRDAVADKKIHSTDWASLPLPQQLIRESRAATSGAAQVIKDAETTAAGILVSSKNNGETSNGNKVEGMGLIKAEDKGSDKEVITSHTPCNNARAAIIKKESKRMVAREVEDEWVDLALNGAAAEVLAANRANNAVKKSEAERGDGEDWEDLGRDDESGWDFC